MSPLISLLPLRSQEWRYAHEVVTCTEAVVFLLGIIARQIAWLKASVDEARPAVRKSE